MEKRLPPKALGKKKTSEKKGGNIPNQQRPASEKPESGEAKPSDRKKKTEAQA